MQLSSRSKQHKSNGGNKKSKIVAQLLWDIVCSLEKSQAQFWSWLIRSSSCTAQRNYSFGCCSHFQPFSSTSPPSAECLFVLIHFLWFLQNSLFPLLSPRVSRARKCVIQSPTFTWNRARQTRKTLTLPLIFFPLLLTVFYSHSHLILQRRAAHSRKKKSQTTTKTSRVNEPFAQFYFHVVLRLSTLSRGRSIAQKLRWEYGCFTFMLFSCELCGAHSSSTRVCTSHTTWNEHQQNSAAYSVHIDRLGTRWIGPRTMADGLKFLPPFSELWAYFFSVFFLLWEKKREIISLSFFSQCCAGNWFHSFYILFSMLCFFLCPWSRRRRRFRFSVLLLLLLSFRVTSNEVGL